MRILHTEDDPAMRLAMSRFLTAKGHTVETVRNGQETFTRLQTQPDAYDVLLTDHTMPLLGGLTLVQHLRVPIAGSRWVVFASQLDTQDNAAYRSLGVAGIYTKPMDGRAIPDIIERLILGPPKRPT